MEKIKFEISVEEFLKILQDCNDRRPILELVGRKNLIHKCIELFLENGTIAKDNYSIFNEILFDDVFDGETYKEIWLEFWQQGLNEFPLDYLVDALTSYKPGRRSDKSADVALNFLLYYYYKVELEDLDSDKLENLAKLFEEIAELPSDLIEYKSKLVFERCLLEFEDLEYLNNNYTNVSYDTKVIRELLCKVADSGKIDVDNISVFCQLVDWYAPQNVLGRRYRDVFVLSVFEANENWSEDEFDTFDEFFYNVDFDECAQMYQDNINQSYEDESRHISEQLKISPNYRHD